MGADECAEVTYFSAIRLLRGPCGGPVSFGGSSMRQTAIFVDAGYLFAAGSALISGAKQPRSVCQLDARKALNALVTKAKLVEPGARVLRTYWYDGIKPYTGPTAAQTALGEEPFVKLRLGMLNSQGQQKGVDSLIVTDLIELARNNAIHDALILAGDEDVRVGVQVAQSFGVRVHLLGIVPTRGNVSPHLRQEMDSIAELNATTIKSFLKCGSTKPPPTLSKSSPKAKPTSMAKEGSSAEVLDEQLLSEIIEGVLGRFDATEIEQFNTVLATTGSLPRELDAPVLATARDKLGRDLLGNEKRDARRSVRETLPKPERNS